MGADMLPRFVTAFGADWDQLDLSHLKSFFADPREESLTWEGKGGDIRSEHVRAAVSAFGNSYLPGILVLGVAQDKKTRVWTFDHWEPRSPEPSLWVDQCIGAGSLNPRPATHTKSWDVPGGGKVGCLAVWPVAIPPVITLEGQVWERTSTQSVRVTDPTNLRRLFERGEAARARIYQLSNNAADTLIEIPPPGPLRNAIAFGFAAASVPTDVSSTLFQSSVTDHLAELGKELHRSVQIEEYKRFATSSLAWNQGEVQVRTTDSFANSEAFDLRVGRHGSVGIGFGDPDITSSGALWAQTSHEILQSIWDAGIEILRLLGAVGDIHVAARFTHPNGTFAAAQQSNTEEDGADRIKAIVRDIGRALGRPEWEPEDPP
jgi:hypothetical protein